MLRRKETTGHNTAGKMPFSSKRALHIEMLTRRFRRTTAHGKGHFSDKLIYGQHNQEHCQNATVLFSSQLIMVLTLALTIILPQILREQPACWQITVCQFALIMVGVLTAFGMDTLPH
ncbi:MAG: hypothetical protein R3E79_11695 [Caldilineaceae bacterium]